MFEHRPDVAEAQVRLLFHRLRDTVVGRDAGVGRSRPKYENPQEFRPHSCSGRKAPRSPAE